MSLKLQITKFFGKISNLFFLKREITLEDSEENILSDDTLISEELNIFFSKCNKISKY